MRSPARAIAQILDDNALGVIAAQAGWSISVGREPKKPATTITVYDTPGSGPETDELDFYRLRFQVRVRTQDYEDGYNKSSAIRDLLVKVGPLAVLDLAIVQIVVISDIGEIGKDDNDRNIFVANYQLMTQ